MAAVNVRLPAMMGHRRLLTLCALQRILVLILLLRQPGGSLWGATAETGLPSEFQARYASKTTKKESSSWYSNFVTVNPARILKILVDSCGLIIPSSVQTDIDLLRKVVRVGHAELNVIKRKVILYDFCLGFHDNRPPALQIGRIMVCWDSLTTPNVDIYVDDVDVSVEFTNLIMSKSNWNELMEFGFPPPLIKETMFAETTSEPFVYFNKIDLSGNVTMNFSSRPLGKDVGRMSLDMAVTDAIMEKIEELSEKNFQQTGRKGISSEQLTAFLRDDFNTRIKRLVPQLLKYISNDPEQVKKRVDNMFDSATDAIVGYLGDASEKTVVDLHKVLASKFDRGLGALKKRFGPKEKIVLTTTLNNNRTAEEIDKHSSRSVVDTETLEWMIFPGFGHWFQ